jgi:hypothetical protein
VTTSTQLEELLAPLRRSITCVGHDSLASLTSALAAISPGARLAPLGRMQRPPLDGPVDRREVL